MRLHHLTHPGSSRKVAAVAGLAAVAALTVAAQSAQAATTAGEARHHTIAVGPGSGTISAAVAKASPGDTLQLSAGVYHDSVSVTFPLRITGAGWAKTVISPPEGDVSQCDGGVDGICALGAVDGQGRPDRSKPVEDVTIQDLRVAGFGGSGIFGFNTRGLRVLNVKADHNEAYGVARFVSTDSLYAHNLATYNEEAGFYVGDSPDANSVVRGNTAAHNGFGVFLRDSTHVNAFNNRVWGNCAGIVGLNSGQGAPGDQPAGFYRIDRNSAWANDVACPAGEHPPFSGIGIALLGVHDSLVQGNSVFDNHPTGPSAGSGGVLIASTAAAGGADPSNVTVKGNDLPHNRPADIVWDGSGTGITAQGNDCTKAIPANLGWC